jgi:hypothetical protein
MPRSFRTVLTALLISGSATVVSAQSPWLGTYEFTENGGKNAGGSTIIVNHQIDVLNSDKGLVATLKSNGYQTAVDVLCLVKVNGNKALFYFEGYGDDNMFENYKKGQLMFTLEQGKSDILTHWGVFKPVVPKNERSGKVYFAKVDSNKK